MKTQKENTNITIRIVVLPRLNNVITKQKVYSSKRKNINVKNINLN